MLTIHTSPPPRPPQRFPLFHEALFTETLMPLSYCRHDERAQFIHAFRRIALKCIPGENYYDSCWAWEGARRGGPSLTVGAKYLNPVRILWPAACGLYKAAPAVSLFKHCTTPSCVNPKHYFMRARAWLSFSNRDIALCPGPLIGKEESIDLSSLVYQLLSQAGRADDSFTEDQHIFISQAISAAGSELSPEQLAESILAQPFMALSALEAEPTQEYKSPSDLLAEEALDASRPRRSLLEPR